MSVDGYVAGPNGELDWMTPEKDEALIRFMNDLTDSIDTILLGRKMTDGFMNYWEGVIKDRPDSDEYSFARKMVDFPKIVFTKTLDKSRWTNTILAKGDLVEEVNNIKRQSGKDIIVYGGANFVSSLIKENLIDEYNFLINPIMLGEGMRIFDLLENRRNLEAISGTTYSEGITVLRYRPVV